MSAADKALSLTTVGSTGTGFVEASNGDLGYSLVKGSNAFMGLTHVILPSLGYWPTLH